MNPQLPPPAQWTPPTEPGRPASNGRIAVAVFAVGLIAVAALVVGIIDLTRPTSSDVGKASTAASPPPTFTPDQIASAKKELCTTYQVAARSVKQDTNATDVAIARVAVTNAAGMLDAAANNPALASNDRDAARNLAVAYRNADAISSVFDKGSPVFQQAVDDVNRLDGVMAAMCP
jgi:methyl-accepting chemotaxis protein